MVVEKDGQAGTAGGGANKRKRKPLKMVPLMSGRSVLVLVIGLIIGIGLGLGYYVISPSFSSTDLSTDVSQENSSLIWPEYKGLYESTIQMQIINPGSSYIALRDLANTAEYYVAKANSFPFLDYLVEELEKQAPIYSHTTEELDKMISMTFDSTNDIPVLEIRGLGATEDEALYLTAFVPHVFQDFLSSEEDKLRLQEYELLLADIDEVREALLAAEEELANFNLQSATDQITNDPEYISLNATVAALQAELSIQAAQLAMLISMGDLSTEAYSDTVTAVDRTSRAIADARSSLSTLEAQYSVENVSQNLDYQIIAANINNLNSELARLTSSLTSFLTITDEDSTPDDISVGVPTAPVPSIPDRIRGRDAILLGGILGICGAWVTINFKWITKGMPSSDDTRHDEEERERA